MIEEIWKDIKGYENYYKISNIGNVKSHDREIIRKNGIKHSLNGILKKSSLDKKGYYTIMLSKNGQNKRYFLHRLIAETFIPNDSLKCCVNNINGITTDNSLDNLEWVTYIENAKHAYDTHLISHEDLRERGKLASEVRKIRTAQISREGKILNIFSSFKEAEELTGVNRSAISMCCSGKYKTAGGFIWKRAA